MKRPAFRHRDSEADHMSNDVARILNMEHYVSLVIWHVHDMSAACEFDTWAEQKPS